jgi:hypothetical protein
VWTRQSISLQIGAMTNQQVGQKVGREISCSF